MSYNVKSVAVSAAVASTELQAAGANGRCITLRGVTVDCVSGSFRVLLYKGSGGTILFAATVSATTGPHVEAELCRVLGGGESLYYVIDNAVGPPTGNLIVDYEV